MPFPPNLSPQPIGLFQIPFPVSCKVFFPRPKLNLPVPSSVGNKSLINSGAFFANNNKPIIIKNFTNTNVNPPTESACTVLDINPMLLLTIPLGLLNSSITIDTNVTEKYITVSLKNKSKYVEVHCFTHFLNIPSGSDIYDKIGIGAITCRYAS